MAYSLKSFMNQNQGQQSATSFTQPIKMPLSQSVLKKGIGRSAPLSEVAGVPWSGEGQPVGGTVTPESVSDLAESTNVANVNADNPATLGEALGKGAIVGGLFAGGLPAAGGIAGMVMAGGKVASAVRGMYQSKTEPTWIEKAIDIHIPKLMQDIFGGKSSPPMQGEVPSSGEDTLGQALASGNLGTPTPQGLTGNIGAEAGSSGKGGMATPDSSNPSIGDFGW